MAAPIRACGASLVAVEIGQRDPERMTPLDPAQVPLEARRAAADAEAAARLWDISETLSGVHYPSGTAE